MQWDRVTTKTLLIILPVVEAALVSDRKATWEGVLPKLIEKLRTSANPKAPLPAIYSITHASGTSETGLDRPGIDNVYYQRPKRRDEEYAPATRFNHTQLLEALDCGKSNIIAPVAAVVKSEHAYVDVSPTGGFGLFAKRKLRTGENFCAERIHPESCHHCLHLEACCSIERTLEISVEQEGGDCRKYSYYHPATILLLDGSKLPGGKAEYSSLVFIPQQHIRFVNHNDTPNAGYALFHGGKRVKDVKTYLKNHFDITLEDFQVVLTAPVTRNGPARLRKIAKAFSDSKWEIGIVAIEDIDEGVEITFDYKRELESLLQKEQGVDVRA